MPGDAPIGVDQDLAPREAGIAVGASNDEGARRIHENAGVRVEQIWRDDWLQDMLNHVLVDGLLGYACLVLRADDDGVDALGLTVGVFHRCLGFSHRGAGRG